jgi:four helix bundle protein
MDGVAIRDYKDLRVWRQAVELAKLVYEATRSFPAEEKFGMISQMRRAAVSVASNIAEGQVRNTTGEFIQFICHTRGSLGEPDAQIRLASAFGFCQERDLEHVSGMISDLQKMLNGLRSKVTTNHRSRITG